MSSTTHGDSSATNGSESSCATLAITLGMALELRNGATMMLTYLSNLYKTF